MRLLPTLLIPAAGCAQTGAIEHKAALRGAYDRVEVGLFGGDFHGQSDRGLITRRSTATGEIIEGFDPLPKLPEALHDVLEDDGEPRVLASGPEGFFDWTPDSVAEPLRAEGRDTGVLGARVTARGLALLRDDADDGCVVDWVFPGDVDSVPMPAAACQPDACVVADREADLLLVSGGGATWAVSPTEAEEWLSEGGLCAFDAESGTLATAEAGQRLMVGRDTFGVEQWRVELQFPIAAVTDLSEGGRLAVSLDKGGPGQLLLLDGGTGDPLLAAETPRPAAGLSGGGRGEVLLFRLPDELHVLQVAPATGSD